MPFTSSKKITMSSSRRRFNCVTRRERHFKCLFFFLVFAHAWRDKLRKLLTFPSELMKNEKKRDKSVALKLTSLFFRMFSLSSHHLRHTVSSRRAKWVKVLIHARKAPEKPTKASFRHLFGSHRRNNRVFPFHFDLIIVIII